MVAEATAAVVFGSLEYRVMEIPASDLDTEEDYFLVLVAIPAGVSIPSLDASRSRGQLEVHCTHIDEIGEFSLEQVAPPENCFIWDQIKKEWRKLEVVNLTTRSWTWG